LKTFNGFHYLQVTNTKKPNYQHSYTHRESAMRTVIQRVKEAKVTVNDEIIGEISHGLLLLVAIGEGDTKEEVDWQAEKITKLRIFEDENDKMNRSVEDVSGGILVVPQFTLYGDACKGTRPSFIKAADPGIAKKLYKRMIKEFKKLTDLAVESGKFGAYMDVSLINDGPVTIILER